MRTKEDIMNQSSDVMAKRLTQLSVKVQHDHLLLEVLLDIRDILNKELKRIDTTETRFIKTQ